LLSLKLNILYFKTTSLLIDYPSEVLCGFRTVPWNIGTTVLTVKFKIRDNVCYHALRIPTTMLEGLNMHDASVLLDRTFERVHNYSLTLLLPDTYSPLNTVFNLILLCIMSHTRSRTISLASSMNWRGSMCLEFITTSVSIIGFWTSYLSHVIGALYLAPTCTKRSRIESLKLSNRYEQSTIVLISIDFNINWYSRTFDTTLFFQQFDEIVHRCSQEILLAYSIERFVLPDYASFAPLYYNILFFSLFIKKLWENIYF